MLLSELNVIFDILAIAESRIKKDSSSPTNLHLNNYSIEHTPNESSASGTLLYVNKRLSYQLRNDLWIYDPGKIESTFIEIICSKSTNVIVGCIYKHPILPINDFTNEFISPLLLKLQKESSKIIFLLGDFNIVFLLVLLVLTFYYLLYFYLQGSVKHPIICYKKDSSIFISWLTHCYWFLPYLLF